MYRIALEVYARLRTIRDVLSQPSITTAHAEYRQASKPFWAGLDTLQDVMREDLRSAVRHTRKGALRRPAARTKETDAPLTPADYP